MKLMFATWRFEGNHFVRFDAINQRFFYRQQYDERQNSNSRKSWKLVLPNRLLTNRNNRVMNRSISIEEQQGKTQFNPHVQ